MSVPLVRLAEESPRPRWRCALAEFFTLDMAAALQPFLAAEELSELGRDQVSLRLGGGSSPSGASARAAPRTAYARPGGGAGALEIRSPHPGAKGEGGVVVKGRIGRYGCAASRRCAFSRRQGEAYYFSSHLPHRFKKCRP